MPVSVPLPPKDLPALRRRRHRDPSTPARPLPFPHPQARTGPSLRGHSLTGGDQPGVGPVAFDLHDFDNARPLRREGRPPLRVRANRESTARARGPPPSAPPRSRSVHPSLSEKPAFSDFALGRPPLGLRLYISEAYVNWGRAPTPGLRSSSASAPAPPRAFKPRSAAPLRPRPGSSLQIWTGKLSAPPWRLRSKLPNLLHSPPTAPTTSGPSRDLI